MLAALQPVAILFRNAAAGNLTAGQTVSSGKQRAVGHGRLKGSFYSAEAPAAGYPRARFSEDGSAWTRTVELTRDTSQTGYAYSFDLAVTAGYVLVEWEHAGADATVQALATLSPGGEGQADTGGSSANGLSSVSSDKDTHFTGAIAAGGDEFESLNDLPSSRCMIRSVTLIAEEDLGWEVHFWSSSGKDNADLDLDTWLGMVSFETLGGQIDGAQTHFRYQRALEIPYVDGGSAGQLHVSLRPTQGDKTAGAAGEVRLRVLVDPE